jgi:hypothetical protein
VTDQETLTRTMTRRGQQATTARRLPKADIARVVIALIDPTSRGKSLAGW